MRSKRLLLLAAMVLSACGGGTKRTEEAPRPVQAPEVFRAKFETTKGNFVVEVHRDWAPNGADRFYQLVSEGFYDEAKFFRVVRNFVAQWGIHKDPKVNRLWAQREIADDPVKESNVRGTLTFAARGPNTRTTQVFLNLRDNTSLDKSGFAPIGKVVEGMENVDKLSFVYGDIAPMGPGPDPKLAQAEGNAYFERTWPRLDTMQRVTIER